MGESEVARRAGSNVWMSILTLLIVGLFLIVLVWPDPFGSRTGKADNMLKLGVADKTSDFGIYADYDPDNKKHTGLFYDESEDKWTAFEGLTKEPDNAVATTDTTFKLAPFCGSELSAGREGSKGKLIVYPPDKNRGKLVIDMNNATGDHTTILRIQEHGQGTEIRVPDSGLAVAHLLQSTNPLSMAEADVLSGATLTTDELNGLDVSAGTVGTIASTATALNITVAETRHNRTFTSVFTMAATVITTADGGANGGYGGVKLYDFPATRAILVHASHFNLTAVVPDGTGLLAAAVVEIGVGTTVTAVSTGDGVLNATQTDIVDSGTAITLAASDLAAAADGRYADVAQSYHDGVGTAVDAHLNVAATAVTSTAAGTLTLTGTLTIIWSESE